MSPWQQAGAWPSLMLIALIGCAATHPGAPTADETAVSAPQSLAEDPRVGEEMDRICFTNGISGFSDYNGPEDALILRRGPGREYLVTLFPGCITVDRAQRVAFVDRFSGSCLMRGDEILVSAELFRAGSSLDNDVCRISEVYAYDRDATAAEEEDEAE